MQIKRVLVSSGAALAVIATACSSGIAQEQQSEAPFLKNEEEIIQLLRDEGVEPAAVIVIDPEGNHEVFQIREYPLRTDATINLSDLNVPSLTFQPLGSGVLCGKYGCGAVP